MQQHRWIWGLVWLALLVLPGCKDLLTTHNIELGGVKHGKKLYQGAKDCTACHGISLKGNGWIPGCYDCHGVMWDLSEHQVSRGGVQHKFGRPAAQTCNECHGADLKGRYSRPSCYACHGDVWTAFEALHSVKRGSAWHGHSAYSPNANCTECHGSNLTGDGTTPGCYSCHEDQWSSVMAEHDVLLTNAYHKSGMYTPASNCAECHGSDLKGGDFAPSCYSCHGEKWASFAETHTKSRGSTLHGTNLYAPSSNCTDCHGSDLKGGNTAPSCYSCHGDYWIKSNHNDSEDGYLHANDKDIPSEYCAACHGTALTGGTPPEAPSRSANSCYQCHGVEWDGGGDDGDDD